MIIAYLFDDLGSFYGMVIFAMILAIILANKLVSAQTKGQVAASGIEALIRKFLGGK